MEPQCLNNIKKSAMTFGNSLANVWTEIKVASGLHSSEEIETEFAPPVLNKVIMIARDWLLNSDCSSNGFSALATGTFEKLQNLTKRTLHLPNVDPERVRNKINEASVTAIALQIATGSCFRKTRVSGTVVARSLADGFRHSNVLQVDYSIAGMPVVCELWANRNGRK